MARMGRMLLLARSNNSPRNEGYGTKVEHVPAHDPGMTYGVRSAYMGLESPPSYVRNDYAPPRQAEHMPRDNYGVRDGSYLDAPRDNFEPEERFRDRRGREHYDNGRFAPRSVYDEPESRRDSRGRYARSAYDEPESRRDSRGRYARSAYDDDDRPESRDNVTQFVPPVYERAPRGMNPIGFVTNGPHEVEHNYRNDARYYPRSEMEGSYGHMSRGSASAQAEELDAAMAEEWMQHLHNEDGSRGAHWTMDQAKQVMSQRKIDCDPMEFWVALNAMYSDYSQVFRKHGVGDRVDIYADMAKAFLDDKDAKPHKLANYYLHVVR